MSASSRQPALSVVIVIYNMEREARRSLHALSTAYQRDVSPDDYEVVVVDNGSATPFNGGSVAEFGPNFRYHYVDDARASVENRTPNRAMNIGVSLARSDYLALMVDGARILTPGVLKYGLMLPKMFAHPCGLTLGWHLGPDLQSRSIVHGYSKAVEDELLAQIGWPSEGYRLFEVSSTHDPSDGWFRLMGESNCTFVHRQMYEDVGGYNEGYISHGGGLGNMDLQTRLYDVPHADLVMLIGEGTFHQFHGGATSGAAWSDVQDMFPAYAAEYLALRGVPYTPITGRMPHYVGHMPLETLACLRKFIEVADPKIVSMDKSMTWLRAELAVRDQIIDGRNQAIAWLQGEIAGRDRKIAELHAELDRRPSVESVATEPPA